MAGTLQSGFKGTTKVTLGTIVRSNSGTSAERRPCLEASFEGEHGYSGAVEHTTTEIWNNGVSGLQWFNRSLWDYGESVWEKHDWRLTVLCGVFCGALLLSGLGAMYFCLVLVAAEEHWSYENWTTNNGESDFWLPEKGPPDLWVWLMAAALTSGIISIAVFWGWSTKSYGTVLMVILVSDIVSFLLVVAAVDLLTAIHISSGTSLVGSLYALGGTMRASRNNVRASLLWNVAFNDLLSSVGRFIPVKYCQVQAIVISTGDVGSVFWIAGIANLASFIMGNAVKLRMTSKYAYGRRRNHIICTIWTWTIATVIIPFFTDSYGVSTDMLCWVKDDSLTDKTMQFIQFYAPFMGVMLYAAWVYRPTSMGGIIWQVMRSNERFHGSGTSGHVSNPRVLMIYPLYLLMAWLPGFTSGLILRSVEVESTWLQNLQTVNKSLMGMANATIYFHLDPKYKNDIMRMCGSRAWRHSEHAHGASSNKMPFRFQSSSGSNSKPNSISCSSREDMGAEEHFKKIGAPDDSGISIDYCDKRNEEKKKADYEVSKDKKEKQKEKAKDKDGQETWGSTQPGKNKK